MRQPVSAHQCSQVSAVEAPGRRGFHDETTPGRKRGRNIIPLQRSGAQPSHIVKLSLEEKNLIS